MASSHAAKPRDWGIALQDIWDVDEHGKQVLVTKKGGLGYVLEIYYEDAPLMVWEETGRKMECVLGKEVELLCEADFATTPETTPKKPRRDYLKRGVS